MKIKELDGLINQILEDETKKLIMEQIENGVPDEQGKADSIKKFQTLSGLLDKISGIEDVDDVNFGVVINVNGVSEEDLISSFGGASFEEAQQKLMQGLHHDLEDNGMGSNFDIDIDTEEEGEGTLGLRIKITTGENDLLGDNDMENINEKKDSNFGSELCKAKDSGKQKFMYEGQEFDVQECWKEMEEQESMGEKKEPEILLGNKQEVAEKTDKWIQKAVDPKHKGYCTPMTKATCTPRRKALAKRFKKGIEKESVERRIITLNEEQMKELLKRIISEAAPTEPTMDPTTKNVIDKSGKENADYIDLVQKKIKDYLSFKGNDNPEFPHQIGQGEEKAARQNSKEQDEQVDLNRGRGPQDLDYDTDGVDDNGEPGKKFMDRIEKALVGDTTMGNSQDAAGITKSDTGEKILKSMKKRREALRKEPIYPKEAVPVKTKPESEPVRPVNESVEEEIKKMKHIASYNKKTQ